MDVFAQEPNGATGLGTIGGAGLGPFGTIGTGLGQGAAGGTKALTSVTNIISGVIGFMTIAAAIWFFFQLIIGGISWMSAAGEKNKLNEARDRITNAFIGLIVVVAGWAILSLAGQFFGWEQITLGKPGDVIQQIMFK